MCSINKTRHFPPLFCLLFWLFSTSSFALSTLTASTDSPDVVIPDHKVIINYQAYTDEPYVGFYWFSLYVNGLYYTGQSSNIPFEYDITDDGVYEFVVHTSTGGGQYQSDAMVITAATPQRRGTNDPLGSHVGPLFTDFIDIYGHQVPEWYVGVEGGIPDIATVLYASDFGAFPNDGIDDSVAIQTALDSLTIPGAVQLDEGEYLLNDAIRLTSGQVLRGSGLDKTQISVNHSGIALIVKGSAMRSAYGYITAEDGFEQVLEGADKGSLRVRVNDASIYNAGDFVELVQTYDPSLHETSPAWREEWAGRLIGQYTRVNIVDGNWITLADPIRTDMNYELGVWLSPVDMPEYAGFEDFAIERISANDKSMFQFSLASNGWIKGVLSERAAKSHVSIYKSRHIEVRESIFREATHYGVGGHGYGVEMSLLSIGNLIEDNVFDTLRHAMMVHLGANGNVFAYNYSINPTQDEGGTWKPTDISLHGHYPYSNLFEQNIANTVAVTDYWGPAGPDNVLHRNQLNYAGISGADYSNYQYAIGNKLNTVISFDEVWGVPGFESDTPTIDQSTWVNHHNFSVKLNSQTSEAGYDSVDSPASYLYGILPRFLLDYASISVGYSVAEGSLPAKDRYNAFISHLGAPEPTEPEPTEPEPTEPEPTEPEPTEPEPTEPEPTEPEPTEPEPTEPEPTEPEPTEPEPTEPEPTEPEPTEPEPTEPEPTEPEPTEPEPAEPAEPAEPISTAPESTQPVISAVNGDLSQTLLPGTSLRFVSNITENNRYSVADLRVNGIWQNWNANAPFIFDYTFEFSGEYQVQMAMNDGNGNETVSNMLLVTIDDPSAAPLITNTLGASGINCEVIIASEWLSGFHAQVVLTNTRATNISGWGFDVNFPNGVSGINISSVTRSGVNPITVGNLSWNSDIVAGSRQVVNFYATKEIKNTPAQVSIGGGSCAK